MSSGLAIPGLRRRAVTLVALIACAVIGLTTSASRATAQTDVIRGRVTTSEGLPLANVRVTATSIPGNVTREVRTSDKGLLPDRVSGRPRRLHHGLRAHRVRVPAVRDQAARRRGGARRRCAALGDPARHDRRSSRPSSSASNRNSQTPDVGGTERLDRPDEPPARQLRAISPRWRRRCPACCSFRDSTAEPDGFSVLGLGADQNSVDAERHAGRRERTAARRGHLELALDVAVRCVPRRLQRRATSTFARAPAPTSAAAG